MDLTADLTLAARRAEAKQAVAAQLARFTLPAADRKAILLDLAMEVPVADTVATPQPRATPAAKRGRPRKHTNGASGSLTRKILATLGSEPGIPIRKLSTAVYGDDSKENRIKTRSLLNSLKKQGKVNNPETGKWRVTNA